MDGRRAEKSPLPQARTRLLQEKEFGFLGAVIAITLTAALLGLLHSIAQAATIDAASCSQEDVQAAIDKARDGDVVVVPAGTATWTTPKAWTPSVKIRKGIVLKGAGMDRTVIVDGTVARFGHELLIEVIAEEGKPFRMTGFTFAEVNDHAERAGAGGRHGSAPAL